MKNILRKLIIPQQVFNDADEEDRDGSILGGWSLLLVISLIFAAITVFLESSDFHHTFAKIIIILSGMPFLYAAAGLICRFRDAIFVTRLLLIGSLIAGLGYLLIGFITSVENLEYGRIALAIIIAIAWLYYLSNSLHIKQRFPLSERKIFIIDYLLLIIITLWTILFILFSGFYAINTIKHNDKIEASWSQEKKEVVEQFKESRLKISGYSYMTYDGMEYGDNSVIVTFQVNSDRSIRLRAEQILEELRHVNNVREKTLSDFVESNPEFTKAMIKNNINVTVRFRSETSGIDCYITPQQMQNCLISLREKHSSMEESERRLQQYVEGILKECPKRVATGLVLKKLEIYEGKLIFNFEYDEHITKYEEAKKAVMGIFPEENQKGTPLFPRGIAHDLRNLEWDIEYILKGQNTGFTKKLEEPRLYSFFYSEDNDFEE